MGELKEIRDQQDNLIQRAKALGNKLYLAGLGAYSKAGDSSEELYDKYVQAGQELYEQFVASGKQERGEKAEETNEFVLAGLGAVSTLREQSQKLFDDLVSTGEKERA